MCGDKEYDSAVYNISQESSFEFAVYNVCDFLDDVSFFTIVNDGTVFDFTFYVMDSTGLDFPFTDSRNREFSFRDLAVSICLRR